MALLSIAVIRVDSWQIFFKTETLSPIPSHGIQVHRICGPLKVILPLVLAQWQRVIVQAGNKCAQYSSRVQLKQACTWQEWPQRSNELRDRHILGEFPRRPKLWGICITLFSEGHNFQSGTAPRTLHVYALCANKTNWLSCPYLIHSPRCGNSLLQLQHIARLAFCR